MLRAGEAMPDGWYRDPKILRAEYEEHGSFDAIRVAHGPSVSTLRTWWKAGGLPPVVGGPRRTVTAVPAAETGDEWLLAILKKQGDGATVEALADAADVSPRKVREASERLGLKGYRIEDEGNRVVLRRLPPPSTKVHRALFKGEDITIGVVSDTHLSSKHERLEELHIAYDVMRDEGVTTVLHPGDLVCGMGIFPGQANEIQHHTYEEQVEYAALNYPRRDGITTRIIAGNHDLEGQFGKVGANPVVAVAHQRDDFDYLGDYRATIELEQGTRLYMLHPKGGMGYAADYKVRKLVEGFEGGTKPHALLIGHFHRRFDIEARGVQCLGCGCFEGGGSFGVRLGLSDPAVGFHIVRMRVGDDGSIVKWRADWFRLWPGRTVERLAA
jgi:predicted phosphodiesterase